MSRRLSAAVVFCLAGALLAPGVLAQEISNPKLFDKSLEAAWRALEHYGAVDDREALRRVSRIGYELAAQSSYREFPFSFYLIDMPEPNAFALPGGQIFITRGMLGLGLTDDMLATLLGHEIAHVTRSHGTRMQRRATLLNVLSQALLVGVLVGVDDGPENPRDPYGIDQSTSRKGSLVQGAAATGMVVSELLLRNYSRDFEDEADVEGQRLAAAAGYDPDGARQLWALMNERIPQSKEYGYWRTHPFSDQRMRAAEVRAGEIKIQDDPRPVAGYRMRTQQVLEAFVDKDVGDPERVPFLEQTVLTAWPEGETAERIRLAALERRRDAELERAKLERDYGALLRAYEVELEEVRALTPESPFLARLEREIGTLRAEVEALYPQALAVWREGIYQTPFLETFLSNYPDSELVPEVALALGNAYSRLGREADGVEQYLRAAAAGPGTEAGKRALEGLRNLAPHLERLAALQNLSETIDDPTLSALAHQRLDKLASSYKKLENGAEYLRRFPEGEHSEPVRERLEAVAQNLYGEVVLYQGVGDHLKALERIQEILTHAPTTRAAESLRSRAVLES